jgi:tetratricopeptide (TPR) repeat protein
MSHTILVIVLAFSLAFSAAAPRSQGDSAAAAYRASYQLEASGDFAGALATLAPLSAAGDDSYFLLARLAWLRYLTGDFTAAELGYRRAIAARPQAVEPKVGLTLALLAGGNWKALDLACRDALTSSPTDPGLRSRLASAQYNLGRFPDAAVLYRKLIDDYPATLDYQTGYGWALLRMGKRKQADIVFRSVLAVSPDNVNAQQGLSAP